MIFLTTPCFPLIRPHCILWCLSRFDASLWAQFWNSFLLRNALDSSPKRHNVLPHHLLSSSLCFHSLIYSLLLPLLHSIFYSFLLLPTSSLLAKCFLAFNRIKKLGDALTQTPCENLCVEEEQNTSEQLKRAHYLSKMKDLIVRFEKQVHVRSVDVILIHHVQRRCVM